MNDKILQAEHKILRNLSEEVPLKSIPSKKIQDIASKMHKALANEPDGVALAAPQIGINLRIFVVSPRVFGERLSENETLTYINPKIIKKSQKKVEMTEGCLSVRNIFGKIKRTQKITVEAYDNTGKKFRRSGSGLLSEIFQHEIDHLNGILFTDTAENLIKLDPRDA